MSFPYAADEHAYRAQTERQAPDCPASPARRFRCTQCKQFRGTQGRQKTSAGWRCHACRPKEGA